MLIGSGRINSRFDIEQGNICSLPVVVNRFYAHLSIAKESRASCPALLCSILMDA